MNKVAQNQFITNIATGFMFVEPNLEWEIRSQLIEIVEKELEKSLKEYDLAYFQNMIAFTDAEYTPENLKEDSAICLTSEEYIEKLKNIMINLLEEIKSTANKIKTENSTHEN